MAGSMESDRPRSALPSVESVAFLNFADSENVRGRFGRFDVAPPPRDDLVDAAECAASGALSAATSPRDPPLSEIMVLEDTERDSESLRSA